MLDAAFGILLVFYLAALFQLHRVRTVWALASGFAGLTCGLAGLAVYSTAGTRINVSQNALTTGVVLEGVGTAIALFSAMFIFLRLRPPVRS